jgi:hypothetical protein
VIIRNNNSVQNRVDVGDPVDIDGYIRQFVTRILLSPNDILLMASGEDGDGSEIIHGRILLGGGTTNSGVDIGSINPVSLTCTGGPAGIHSIVVGQEQVALSDVNGLRISSDNNGIIITDWGNFKVAHIPWDS